MAKMPSISQAASQRSSVGWRNDIHAAASALKPIVHPPQPGTAVTDPARSMVSRMNRRLSMAWWCSETGSRRGSRIGSTVGIKPIIRNLLCVVKWIERRRRGVFKEAHLIIHGPFRLVARLQAVARPDLLDPLGDHLRIMAL